MHSRRALPVLSNTDVIVSRRRVPRRRRWAAAGLALGAVLTMGACSDKEEPSVASAVGAGATPAAAVAAGTKAELAAYVQSQRVWARCLRQNGIPNAPDPDETGDVRISVDNPADTSGKEEREKGKSFKACEKFQTEMSRELRESLEPPLTPAQIAAEKGFSGCMRKNGVPNYPDPGPNGKMAAAAEKLQDKSSSDADYGTAWETCAREPTYVEAYPVNN
jgi:hypothetical protein